MAIGLGGNPYGPAGTGKTESVKALGGLFGRQVLVFNCDEVKFADLQPSGIDVLFRKRVLFSGNRREVDGSHLHWTRQVRGLGLF